MQAVYHYWQYCRVWFDRLLLVQVVDRGIPLNAAVAAKQHLFNVKSEVDLI